MKKILFVLLLCCSFSLFAKNASFKGEDYSVFVSYNEDLVPGDAIFIRMKLHTSKFNKKNTSYEKRACLQLYKKDKLLQTTPFYTISKTKKNHNVDMLCGIPLSSWLEDSEYSLKVIFTIAENDDKEFTLPLNFKDRIFNSETVHLDAKNTSIKTDNSPKRATQINNLNDILFSSIYEDIFALENFEVPTPSTRYTSYFGDRRVYKYSNGKSSTSLHYGNDYGIPEGSEVLSCASGKVVMEENRISTGYSIVIEHVPGLYSLYYHLSQMDVKEGDMVKKGQLIGLSGSTGLATGPHLHWEMRLNGEAVRPEFFLSNFTFSEED